MNRTFIDDVGLVVSSTDDEHEIRKRPRLHSTGTLGIGSQFPRRSRSTRPRPPPFLLRVTQQVRVFADKLRLSVAGVQMRE
jgi:hypothetical protein